MVLLQTYLQCHQTEFKTYSYQASRVKPLRMFKMSVKTLTDLIGSLYSFDNCM